jgi:phage baseplate assembly protein W
MAFGARRIDPSDFDPNIGVGVNLPFNGSGVFNTTYQTREAIKANLINYFLTNPGERIANPTFGAGLRTYIFTQIDSDNLDFIKEEIQKKLQTNFPTITVDSIDIFGQEEYNTVNVVIKYIIENTGTNDSLQMTFT